MCARYTLTLGSQSLADVFEIAHVHDFAPRWNVAPTQTVPVVVEGPRGVRRVEPMRWGLVPSWADDLAIGSRMINARAETAATKPSFRAAMRSRRCLVPADGFYEWTGPAGDRRPLRIRRKDGAVFAFAGLWEVWTKGREPVETFTILTTAPNDLLRSVHDRMPVILDPADFARWLDPDAKDPSAVADLAGLLVPCPEEAWEMVRVSRWVNDARHEGPDCVLPAGNG
ncbi:MAG: SOS response-associated peptidase [Planctomycetes bacterium]|nr:SOS response-associated peptidase [Planctomycetota bacterium]